MRHPIKIEHTLAALLVMVISKSTLAAPEVERAPNVEAYLVEGKLAEGEKAVNEALNANPNDDRVRLGLGVVQFLRAVEARMQALHRYGYRADLGAGFLPVSNLPVPPNADPKPLDYLGLRAFLQDWVNDLRKTEATLARVKDPQVKLPLHFGLIRLDFNGDGRRDEEETLWKIYARFNRNTAITAEEARGFVIAFDRGDVDWLRGYCHFLMAAGELVLAHDFSELFSNTAHVFFRGVKPRFPFLSGGREGGRGFGEFLDLIAMIHLIRLPVAEPARLKVVVEHLQAMGDLSRSSWKAILAETDDDHEWIPNPKQATVVPGGQVTPEMVEGWTTFLDEFQEILAGRKLLPFWRGTNGRVGINLRRVFTDPRTLDLVLWVQGTAAAPYLEEGQVTSSEVWQRLNRVFRGEFIGFALWFN
jgi:hypothetical protein